MKKKGKKIQQQQHLFESVRVCIIISGKSLWIRMKSKQILRDVLLDLFISSISLEAVNSIQFLLK